MLLLLLWVRSYYQTVFAVCPLPDPYGSLLIETKQGRVTFCLSYGQGVVSGRNASRWGIHHKSIEEWEPVEPPLSTKADFSFIRWKGNLYYLILPYWFLVAMGGAFAAFPWIPWRFSLRTLLITVTVIGLILGLIFATTR